MSRGFGISHYADASNDDGSDEFVIEKYKNQILQGTPVGTLVVFGDSYVGEIIYPDASKQTAAKDDDSGYATADNSPMSEITRSEFTEALSAIEERMDRRMDRADQQSERRAQDVKEEIALRDAAFRSEQAIRERAADERFQSFLAVQAERDKRIEASFGHIKVANGEIKAGISSMKNTLIVTAVSAVLAIVIGIASFNATLTSNMLAAFQLGKAETVAPASAPNPPPIQQPQK